MVGGTIHTDDKMNGYLHAKNYVTAILEIKTAIARIIYDVRPHVRQQLALADAALATKYPEEEIDLAAAWDEYRIDLLEYISTMSKLFIKT
ncbi:hypothetical protein N7520_003077 [Penicillium odoratum]|uniref:uncharacterized protein n=1 Tax=Penicillium odoratum TaxID=1167516 RepID=UPI0025489EB7|nr:uncharacterized protein N7520_003077 [Penicillium odoratum]KAJ5772548.1 hypothetical protein N7520_003077 [Penicillium odoratum]